MKKFLAHGSQKLQKPSWRSMLALASMHEFGIWLTDVKVAHIPSTEPITLLLFVRYTAGQFVLAPDEYFELLKLLYGLNEGDL